MSLQTLQKPGPTRASAAFIPEADGLRALAIAAVMAYHAFPRQLPGGFLGVDVFFVLSGFLISRLIITRDAQGCFSLKHFYAQRAKRLLPMFLLTLLLVWGVAWNRFFPEALQDLGSTGFAAVLSFANYCFATKTGYFDASAESSPLLHTWSLSVEEQFYFLFPTVFLFFWRRRSAGDRWLAGFVTWTVAAWGLSCFLTQRWPLHGFYGLESRAWELAAGVVVALLESEGKKLPERLALPAGLLGLALCVGSFFGFSEASAVPGPVAAVPVLGTVLLLWSRAGGVGSPLWQGAVWAPVQYVGRLSYSLYLLHWPLLVFQQFEGVGSPWAALGLAFLLAVVLHHTVENPIRYSMQPAVLRRMGWVALGMVALLAGFSKWVRVHKGFVDAPGQKWYVKVLPDAHRKQRVKTSLLPMGLPGGTPEVLLIGDSHAESLFKAMDDGLKAAGKTGAFWWAPGNFPGKGVITSEYSAQFDRDLESLARGPWKTVIFCSNWQGNLVFVPRGSVRPKVKNRFSTPEEGFSIVVQGLLEAIRSFGSRRVILVGQIPRMDCDLPVTMARWMRGQTPFPENWLPEATVMANGANVRRLIEAVQKQHPVTTIDPLQVFSENGRMRYHDGLRSFYKDEGHLSERGAQELVPKLLEQL